MTPFDIEQMRADREAGTPAPWSAFEDEVTGIKASDGRVAVCTQITLMHRRFASEVAANARRIARVPDMEAEILRLREALEETTDMCSQCLFETILIRGQYVDRKEAVSRARAALNGDAP